MFVDDSKVIEFLMNIHDTLLTKLYEVVVIGQQNGYWQLGNEVVFIFYVHF